MPAPQSAGLLLFMRQPELRVLLAHPGGPFFANKDFGAWSIPKGLVEHGEDLLTAARREFEEETGYGVDPSTAFLPLGQVVLRSSKVVHAWAFEGDWQVGRQPESNLFEIEWPPRSGRRQAFPEIDRAECFPLPMAIRKIAPGQLPLVERLVRLLDG